MQCSGIERAYNAMHLLSDYNYIIPLIGQKLVGIVALAYRLLHPCIVTIIIMVCTYLSLQLLLSSYVRLS